MAQTIGRKLGRSRLAEGARTDVQRAAVAAAAEAQVEERQQLAAASIITRLDEAQRLCELLHAEPLLEGMLLDSMPHLKWDRVSRGRIMVAVQQLPLQFRNADVAVHSAHLNHGIVAT